MSARDRDCVLNRTLIDRRLYLPTSWTDDRERCRRAGIDDSIAFETKVSMAKAMIRRYLKLLFSDSA